VLSANVTSCAEKECHEGFREVVEEKGLFDEESLLSDPACE
jgi:hypothetical protein